MNDKNDNMMTNQTEADRSRQDDGKFRIDFIDPLFAVAIHIGIVEGLMHEKWLQEREFPWSLYDFSNLFLFVAILIFTMLGYAFLFMWMG
jgi:hypothetical protein